MKLLQLIVEGQSSILKFARLRRGIALPCSDASARARLLAGPQPSTMPIASVG